MMINFTSVNSFVMINNCKNIQQIKNNNWFMKTISIKNIIKCWPIDSFQYMLSFEDLLSQTGSRIGSPEIGASVQQYEPELYIHHSKIDPNSFNSRSNSVLAKTFLILDWKSSYRKNARHYYRVYVSAVLVPLRSSWFVLICAGISNFFNKTTHFCFLFLFQFLTRLYRLQYIKINTKQISYLIILLSLRIFYNVTSVFTLP